MDLPSVVVACSCKQTTLVVNLLTHLKTKRCDTVSFVQDELKNLLVVLTDTVCCHETWSTLVYAMAYAGGTKPLPV